MVKQESNRKNSNQDVAMTRPDSRTPVREIEISIIQNLKKFNHIFSNISCKTRVWMSKFKQLFQLFQIHNMTFCEVPEPLTSIEDNTTLVEPPSWSKNWRTKFASTARLHFFKKKSHKIEFLAMKFAKKLLLQNSKKKYISSSSSSKFLILY